MTPYDAHIALRDLNAPRNVKNLIRVLFQWVDWKTMTCYPSMDSIAEAMSLSRGQTERVMRRARELGIIKSQVFRGHKTSIHTIMLGSCHPAQARGQTQRRRAVRPRAGAGGTCKNMHAADQTSGGSVPSTDAAVARPPARGERSAPSSDDRQPSRESNPPMTPEERAERLATMRRIAREGFGWLKGPDGQPRQETQQRQL